MAINTTNTKFTFVAASSGTTNIPFTDLSYLATTSMQGLKVYRKLDGSTTFTEDTNFNIVEGVVTNDVCSTGTLELTNATSLNETIEIRRVLPLLQPINLPKVYDNEPTQEAIDTLTLQLQGLLDSANLLTKDLGLFDPTNESIDGISNNQSELNKNIKVGISNLRVSVQNIANYANEINVKVTLQQTSINNINSAISLINSQISSINSNATILSNRVTAVESGVNTLNAQVSDINTTLDNKANIDLSNLTTNAKDNLNILPQVWVNGTNYKQGAVVSYNSRIYTSLVNGNTYVPDNINYWQVNTLYNPLQSVLYSANSLNKYFEVSGETIYFYPYITACISGGYGANGITPIIYQKNIAASIDYSNLNDTPNTRSIVLGTDGTLFVCNKVTYSAAEPLVKDTGDVWFNTDPSIYKAVRYNGTLWDYASTTYYIEIAEFLKDVSLLKWVLPVTEMPKKVVTEVVDDPNKLNIDLGNMLQSGWDKIQLMVETTNFTWKASTTYPVGAITCFDSTGTGEKYELYRCIQEAVGNLQSPSSDSYWYRFNDENLSVDFNNFSSVGNTNYLVKLRTSDLRYDASIYYNVGAVVVGTDQQVYVCKTAGSGGLSPSADVNEFKWVLAVNKKFIKGLSRLWDATISYSEDAMVIGSDSKIYQSLISNNLNNDPATSNQWLRVATDSIVDAEDPFLEITNGVVEVNQIINDQNTAVDAVQSYIKIFTKKVLLPFANNRLKLNVTTSGRLSDTDTTTPIDFILTITYTGNTNPANTILYGFNIPPSTPQSYETDLTTLITSYPEGSTVIFNVSAVESGTTTLAFLEMVQNFNITVEALDSSVIQDKISFEQDGGNLIVKDKTNNPHFTYTGVEAGNVYSKTEIDDKLERNALLPIYSTLVQPAGTLRMSSTSSTSINKRRVWQYDGYLFYNYLESNQSNDLTIYNIALDTWTVIENFFPTIPTNQYPNFVQRGDNPSIVYLIVSATYGQPTFYEINLGTRTCTSRYTLTGWYGSTGEGYVFYDDFNNAVWLLPQGSVYIEKWTTTTRTTLDLTDTSPNRRYRRYVGRNGNLHYFVTGSGTTYVRGYATFDVTTLTWTDVAFGFEIEASGGVYDNSGTGFIWVPVRNSNSLLRWDISAGSGISLANSISTFGGFPIIYNGIMYTPGNNGRIGRYNLATIAPLSDLVATVNPNIARYAIIVANSILFTAASYVADTNTQIERWALEDVVDDTLFTQEQFNNQFYKDRPDKWPSNTEIDFGDGTYGYRATGNITQAANSLNTISLVNGVSQVISQGGWFKYGTTSDKMSIGVSGNTPSNTYANLFNQITSVGVNDTLTIKSFTDAARSGNDNSAYDVWLIYTKVV